MLIDTDPAAVIAFWRAAGPRQWFAADPGFDQQIRDRFAKAHHAASCGTLFAWEDDAVGALALLLLTDQFPRNIYRGSAHAFATDALAREVAGRALAKGFDQATDPVLRAFFYLPFEHDETLASQDRAVALFEQLGDADSLKWAVLHRDLIVRFGRFPHRNAVMGRAPTPEETAYLADGGFTG